MKGSVSKRDNTDDAEPSVVTNKHQMAMDFNHSDLRQRPKMKLNFDPFEPQSPLENSMKGRNDILGGQLENTINSKVLRALESPKSVQSDPDPKNRIAEKE